MGRPAIAVLGCVDNRRPFWIRAAGRISRPIRKLQSEVGVFADYASWRMHDQLLRRSSLLEEGHAYPICVRELGKRIVYCRPNTTDIDVFDDTFFGRYHLPPSDLAPVRTILDLGSNIGLTMAHYAVLFPAARVLGVELDSGNYAMCVENIRPFGPRCTAIHGAVWTSDGSVAYEGPAHWAFRVTGPAASGGVRSYTVRKLLDEWDVARVDFIKMDVEGAEDPLLDTAETWISRFRCLKVEIHEPFTVEQCLARLRRLGLSCSRDRTHRSSVVAWNT